MNICYEITGVPLPRESNPVFSPGAELAARLKPGGTLQIRFHRGADRVRCYAASDSGETLYLALQNLIKSGYGLSRAEMPDAGQTEILLGRKFQKRILLTVGKPAQNIFLPLPSYKDAKHAAALMEAIHAMPPGCGLHFSIRRIQGLSSGAVTWLHRMETEDQTVNRLLFEDALYQMVGCLYGPAFSQSLLLAELQYVFPGLCSVPVPPMNVSDEILDRYRNVLLPESVQELASVQLPEEVAALTDLTGSAGCWGLPLNRDTLFGMPWEVPQYPEKSIHLGKNTRGDRVDIPLCDLPKHVLMTASPGQGKGNLIASIAMQLHSYGIHFLIIEGEKRETHHLRKKIPGLQVWEPTGGSFVFNPFALPQSVTLGEYRSFMKTMITDSFDTEGPLESLFADAMNRVFAQKGYTDASCAGDEGTCAFGLSEFMEAFSAILNEPGYSSRTQMDIKRGGLARLQTLFSQDKRVFDSVNTVPIQELLTGENVLQLNCLSSDAKQVVASLMLLSISAFLRLRGRTVTPGDVKLVILLDEAHALLQNTVDSQGRRRRFVIEYEAMLKTMRSLGVGMVTISQSTRDLSPAVADGCETKLFLGASSDVNDYRAVLHADDVAMEHLYLLHPGEGIYSKPTLPSGVYFKSPLVLDQLRLDEEYPSHNDYLEKNPRFTLETFAECEICPARGRCTRKIKEEAQRLSSVLQSTKFSGYHEPQKTGTDLLAAICTETDDIPLRYCSLIHMIRDINRKSPGSLELTDLMRQVIHLWK